MWLLLTGKHLCCGLFLILSIAKFLRKPILKNICERLLLKTHSWNWEKLKFIHKDFYFYIKNSFFWTSIWVTSSWLVFHDWFLMKISLVRWEINFNYEIFRVNQKKIKSSRKEYVMWTNMLWILTNEKHFPKNLS